MGSLEKAESGICSYRISGKADMENYREFADFVAYALAHLACRNKNIVRMQVAFDELYTNICDYSGAGSVAVSIGVERDSIVYMVLEDDGSPYNPLARPDPDISAPLAERGEGGLGIYLVKKRVSELSYTYQNGMNRLQVMIKETEEEKA